MTTNHKKSMLCFGHRGAKGHEPENTLLAIEKGIKLGTHWIEVDVQAVEGQLVIMHDYRLEGTTTGTGYVADRSLNYIRSLDAGKGQRVPLLPEVFEIVNKRAGLNIELKGPDTAQLVVPIIEYYVEDRGWRYDQILVSSFDLRQLHQIRVMQPHIRIGTLVVGIPLNYARFAQELGAHSIHPHIQFVNRAFVLDAHRRGLKVFVFTVNHPEDIDRMASLGVDGVFSDYPERVLLKYNPLSGQALNRLAA